MIFTSAQEMIIALLEQNTGSYLMKIRRNGTGFAYRLMCNNSTPITNVVRSKIDALIELGAIEKIDNKFVLSKKYLDQKTKRPGINQAAGR